MSARKKQKFRDATRQAEIGAQIALARKTGVGWKTLERVYLASRVQLWRYMRVSRGTPENETS